MLRERRGELNEMKGDREGYVIRGKEHA